MRIRAKWMVLPLLALLLSAQSSAFEFFQPVQPPRPFQVMAHRGAMRQAPENTRPAIELAIQDGFEWAEIDVRLTKDHKHVIFHNSTVDGKTDGTGKIEDLTLEQIKQLDAGSWFAKRFAGERILTLAECLSIAKGHINLYLDCKNVDADLLTDEVMAAGMEKQVIVFGGTDMLAEVRKHSNGTVPIMPKWAPGADIETFIADTNPDAVEINAKDITPEVCQKFHDAHVVVQAQTLHEGDDTPESWDRLLDAGVDWLQTDLAEDIIAHRTWRSLANRPVMISCHRGANTYAPENTIAAFDKAIAFGVDYVEFDIHTTKDNQYVIVHDRSLNRTTSGTGLIRDDSAAHIATLDAGSWFGKPFAGAKVPTLDETMQLLSEHLKLYVDAKDIPPKVLADKLAQYKVVDRSVVYQGPQYLIELRAINPDIRGLCPLGDPAKIDELSETVHPYGFDTSWDILSKDLIQKCHDLGIKVFSDAMDEHETIEDYQRAIDWGIDLIQTDRPLHVIRAVTLRQAQPAAHE